MDMSAVNYTGSVQQRMYPAVRGHSVSVTDFSANAAFEPRKDSVDAVSLESIGRVFKMLNEEEALAIPEPVGRAIKVLVKEVLEGLPSEGVFAH